MSAPRKSVLVVEDEAIVALDIKQRLQAIGYDVVGTAANGQDAISAAAEHRPDLILMDIVIQGDMDGIETAENILATYEVPIVYLTANSDEATLQRAKGTGPMAYLLKPFQDRDLRTALEIALYRHDLERELKDREQWWLTTLNSIGDAVIATDGSGHVTFLNPIAENLTLWASDAAVGRPLEEIFKVIDEATGAPQDNPVKRVLASGETVLLGNHSVLQRPDGTLLPIGDSAAPIVSGNKNIVGAVLIFRDVTERRARGQQIQHYQQQLEERVRARTADLEATNRLLRVEMAERARVEADQLKMQRELARAERMKSVGLLAGGVAHDLNNMLGPIVGYPELIIRKLPTDSPLVQYAETIKKAAQDAAAVVQDLLTLARRGRYQLIPINLKEVLADFVASPIFERLKSEHPAVSYDLEIDHDLPNILGSGPHLAKLVMNLVLNATEAIEGPGSVAIRATSSEISHLQSGYKAIKPGSYAILSVRDTGCGINDEDLVRIFEPYYSSKQMTRSGSGLGLSVVYGVLKDHEGYYDVVSEVGQGTEFLMYFPATAQSAVTSRSVPAYTCGDESILVVDDNEDLLQLATDMLQSLGYSVDVAINGREALRKLENRAYDLVLLDMIMEEGFGGLETYEEILKIRPNQRAIIVSGFSHDDHVTKVQQLGAGVFVKKPFTLECLATAVRSELAPKMPRSEDVKPDCHTGQTPNGSAVDHSS